MQDNICLSGGADGADTAWGNKAKAMGHKVSHFTFKGHKGSKGPDAVIIDPADLVLADPTMTLVNKVLKRSFPAHSEFVTNLLRRNYFQVRDTNAVYSIAGIDGQSVFGGTAWAVEAYKILYPNSDRLYVYDERQDHWFGWTQLYWSPIEPPPEPQGRWTGIGSREIGPKSLAAIESIFN